MYRDTYVEENITIPPPPLPAEMQQGIPLSVGWTPRGGMPSGDRQHVPCDSSLSFKSSQLSQERLRVNWACYTCQVLFKESWEEAKEEVSVWEPELHFSFGRKLCGSWEMQAIPSQLDPHSELPSTLSTTVTQPCISVAEPLMQGPCKICEREVCSSL